MSRFPKQFVVLLLLFFVTKGGQTEFVNVHINVDKIPLGKGLAVSRGLDCFVITAWHVVEEPLPITVVGKERRSSNAAVFWQNEQKDLAVLEIENASAICAEDTYVDLSQITSLLGDTWAEQLRVRDESGSVDTFNFSVSILSGEYFEAIPLKGESIDLGERLSGSVLFSGNVPLGLMLNVSTALDGAYGGFGLKGVDSVPTAKFYRFDYLQQLISNFLYLEAPIEEKAKYDDQLAAEMTRKSLSYVKTNQFCLDLWKQAKFVARPEETFYYDKKEQLGGDTRYIKNSLLIPGMNSVYVGGKHRSLETTVARVPNSLDFKPVWRKVENAVDACITSETNKQVGNIRVRSHLRRHEVQEITMWLLQRTGESGFALESVNIWLEAGANTISIMIWSWD